MKVQIRNDAVVIDGYVNVVERESNPIGLGKKFIERIKAGAFGKSLQRRSNVKVLFNHNPERELASTGAGTATMKEDAVGLYCRAVVSDKDVVEKAKEGKLSGWSFGFAPLSDRKKTENDMEYRDIYELDLVEVSILDDTKNPAYPACCIATRDSQEGTLELRYIEDRAEVEEKSTPNDGVDDKVGQAENPVDGNYQYRNRLYKARI